MINNFFKIFQFFFSLFFLNANEKINPYNIFSKNENHNLFFENLNTLIFNATGTNSEIIENADGELIFKKNDKNKIKIKTDLNGGLGKIILNKVCCDNQKKEIFCSIHESENSDKNFCLNDYKIFKKENYKKENYGFVKNNNCLSKFFWNKENIIYSSECSCKKKCEINNLLIGSTKPEYVFENEKSLKEKIGDYESYAILGEASENYFCLTKSMFDKIKEIEKEIIKANEIEKKTCEALVRLIKKNNEKDEISLLQIAATNELKLLLVSLNELITKFKKNES